jgi:hypothetical protein
MAAVLEGEPDRPVELTPGPHIRAANAVTTFAPKALERADRWIRQREPVEPQSIRADLARRMEPYTARRAAV